ncbi:Dynein light chain [Meloidogyne graminicola]|uniref:Dynein light chain n=1 Tax=Meloidogyne graminicola TaxID=189291 RepID=A0A8S9ZSZ1_9BILA|nr:Dynein light chain [Meloidogyne graminicola]
MKIKTPKEIEDWLFSVNSNNKTLNNSNENNTLIDEENEEIIKNIEELINYLEANKQIKNKNLNKSGLFKNIQFLFLFLFIIEKLENELNNTNLDLKLNKLIIDKKICKKNVTIIKSQISKELENEAKDYAVLGFFKYNNNNTEIAKYIRDKFDNKYGKEWCCIVGQSFGAAFYYKLNQFIVFDLDELRILLFRVL